MTQSNFKTKILRFFWGLFPWLIVILIVAFIVNLSGQIKVEKAKLTEAKKAAIKKEVPAVRVITMTLKPGRLEDKINLPAEVVPHENLWVKSEVPGQVVAIPVKEGQMVRKRQVLIRLDDRDLLSQLERIEANYELAKLEYDRIATLVKKKITAATNLDKIKAQLKDLTAQRTMASLALSRTRIIAPIGGRLNAIKTEVGDQMVPGKAVAQILQFSKVKVVVGVPESDVASVLDLDEATVIIEALDKRKVKGRKIFLSRQPRTMARLYDLELMIPNPKGHILPGMFARVELVKNVFEKALTVPLYAVITKGDERFVYVEKDGRAEKRTVELGVLVDWQVQITAGLKPEERVVVVGHRFLDDGQVVEVIKNVSHPREILES
jgi:membrane fusion protein (multidrug efflux system)